MKSLLSAFHQMLRLIVLGLAALTVQTTSAAEPRVGPLAALPSASGPDIEKIKAVGDGEWLSLDSPAPDLQWGKARGRAWGCPLLES